MNSATHQSRRTSSGDASVKTSHQPASKSTRAAKKKKSKVKHPRGGKPGGRRHHHWEIAETEAQSQRKKHEATSKALAASRTLYNLCSEKHGQVATQAIVSGLDLARSLLKASRTIEAQRLLTNLVLNCNSSQGADHDLTKRIESELQFCKEREVEMCHQGECGNFLALRYEDGGKKCVVQGPIEAQSKLKASKGETITVDSDRLIYLEGTPVVCHGLEGSLSGLNGKIGELTENTGGGQYEVYFEDNDFDPCVLHCKNFRILFELPGVEGSNYREC